MGKKFLSWYFLALNQWVEKSFKLDRHENFSLTFPVRGKQFVRILARVLNWQTDKLEGEKVRVSHCQFDKPNLFSPQIVIKRRTKQVFFSVSSSRRIKCLKYSSQVGCSFWRKERTLPLPFWPRRKRIPRPSTSPSPVSLPWDLATFRRTRRPKRSSPSSWCSLAVGTKIHNA